MVLNRLNSMYCYDLKKNNQASSLLLKYTHQNIKASKCTFFTVNNKNSIM